MQLHNRGRLRWIGVDGQQVVAVIDDTDSDEVRAWCRRRDGARIHLTACQHASEAQRAAVRRLTITMIPAGLGRPMGAGGAR